MQNNLQPINKKNIKVLHLVSDDRTGGIKVLLEPILKGLNSAGASAELCILSSKVFADSIKIGGVHTYYLGKSFTFDLRVIYQLVKILKSGNYQILHTHSLSNNFYGRLASIFIPKLKVVTSVHSDLKRVMRNSHGSIFASIAYSLERMMARLTDLFLPVSSDIVELLIARGLPADKIVKVTNGVDLSLQARLQSQLSPAGGESDMRSRLGLRDDSFPVLMTIGRLNRIKNHEMLIKAAAILKVEMPGLRVVIIGGGPLKSQLDELIDELDVREQVVLTGNLSEAFRYIECADIFLITSFYEGIPVSGLEALFFGKPLIASRVGGLPEIVEDGVNGFLIEPGDVNNLADKVKLLTSDNDLRPQMGENSVLRLKERFSERDMIDGLISAYEKVLGSA